MLQKVANKFASWLASKIVVFDPHCHTEKKYQLIDTVLVKAHLMMYVMVMLTKKAIFIMLLWSHRLMFLYQMKTPIVRRKKKVLMEWAIGLNLSRKSMCVWLGPGQELS